MNTYQSFVNISKEGLPFGVSINASNSALDHNYTAFQLMNMIKGNESHVKYFQFWVFDIIFWQLKNAIFWYKPQKNWMSVYRELWAIYRFWNNIKTKENFYLFLCQYLKNDICDIQLVCDVIKQNESELFWAALK